MSYLEKIARFVSDDYQDRIELQTRAKGNLGKVCGVDLQ